VIQDVKDEDVFRPAAKALFMQRAVNLRHDNPVTNCLPAGPQAIFAAGSTRFYRIVQSPSVIALLYELGDFRQIYTDGRQLPKDPNPTWMGYSVGHWDGDTLVVESFGFNDRTWLDHDGHPHTEALRMTERYRRRDFGNLDIDVTLSDPTVYAKPWTVSVRAELAADTELIEWVCNEKGSGVEHYIGKASDEQKSAVKVSQEILSKYVGTYEEQPKLWRLIPRIVVITLSDGILFADMDGRGKVPLVAQSENGFSGLYGLGVDFVKSDGNRPAQLFVKHVSGDYRFERKK